MHETARSDASNRAVLVAVQLPGVSDDDAAASLDELHRLARTLGLSPVARLSQKRPALGAAGGLGAGKLRELARWTGGPGVVPPGAARRVTGARPAEPSDAEAPAAAPVDAGGPDEDGSDDAAATGPAAEHERAGVVLFDHDLSPSQLRNLAAATGAEVLDRSSLILAIFQRHARTRQARLQVEMARLAYVAPRLRVSGGGDRQQGGIGGRGTGESALELDRRRVRDRLAALAQELAALEREAGARRTRRVRADTVALVGYTNAGKSSLMRALTGSEVLVADRLFATLDTTVRVLQPPTRPRLLVSDTVGFIRKLPHDLIASFRSTLEEAREAALLLHVLDAADPAWRQHHGVAREVLAEIGAGDRPVLLVFNKADRIDDAARAALAAEFPDAFIGSALRPEDVAGLRDRVAAWFEADMVDGELFVPHARHRFVHEIHEACRVLRETALDSGTRLAVRAPGDVLDRLRARLSAGESASATG